MASTYNWTITRDFISTGATGQTGPANKSRHTANQTDFEMYDDDGVLYYRGSIFGDFDGFEPLDDFGMPNAGCTEIRLKNATTGKFETL